MFSRCGALRRQEKTMGLLDVLNGMAQGPRGPSTSSSSSSQSGGMSPPTMALLGPPAWEARQHQTPPPPGPPRPPPSPPPAPPGGPGGGLGGGLGGLGDILKGPLGGVLGGAAAGSVLSGGLGDLMKQLQQGGQGEAANSWVGTGPNKSISPGDLASALGVDQIDQLSSPSGLSRDALLSGVSQLLPQAIDHLTPDGRLPTDNEVSGRL